MEKVFESFSEFYAKKTESVNESTNHKEVTLNYTDGTHLYYIRLENGMYWGLYNENGKMVKLSKALEEKNDFIKDNKLKSLPKDKQKKVKIIIKESVNDSKVNEDHIVPGTTVKVKSTGQVGTLMAYVGADNQYTIQINGTDDTIMVDDEDVEIMESHIQAGSTVKIISTGQVGTLMSLDDNTSEYTVQINGTDDTVKVSDNDLEIAE